MMANFDSNSDEGLRREISFSGDTMIVQDVSVDNRPKQAGWKKRRAIVVEKGTLSKSVIDFPVAVRYTPDAEGDPSGLDVWFSLSGDPTFEVDALPCERVEGPEGSFVFWVLVPRIVGPEKSTLYMFYGDGVVENPGGVWDGYKAVHHMTTSMYRTVPLFQGIPRQSTDDNQYAQEIDKNGLCIAAKKFNNAEKNCGGLRYGDPAYTDHLFVCDLRCSVPDKIEANGFFEIGSSGTPDDEAIVSDTLRHLGITSQWKTFAIPMGGWVDADVSGVLGTATVVAGTSSNDPRQIRKVSGSYSFANDFPIHSGILITGTPDEYRSIAKHGPLVLDGALQCTSASPTVKGVNTSFTTQVKVGDVIQIGSTVLEGVVDSVDSDTEITMDTNQTVTIGTEADTTTYEAGYVGTADNIAYLESAVTVTHTAKDIYRGKNVIDLTEVNFIRWKQFLDAKQGRIEFRNARVVYPVSDMVEIQGQVSVTAGSAIVTGLGTSFVGTVEEGMSVLVNGHLLPGFVGSITDADTFTMTVNSDVSMTGATVKVGMMASTLLDSSGNHISLERFLANSWDTSGYTQNSLSLVPGEGLLTEGILFGGQDGYLQYTSGLLLEENSFTFEICFRADSGTQLVLLGNSKMSLFVTGDGVTLEWNSQEVVETVGPTTLLSDGEWHYIGLCRDKARNTITVYVDGVSYPVSVQSAGSDFQLGEISDDHGGEPFFIGGEGNCDILDGDLSCRKSTNFRGTLCEARIALVPRLAGWFEAMAHNLFNTLVTIGIEEDGGNGQGLPAGLPISLGAGGTIYVS